MLFGIEIRNVDTGLAVTLDNAQAVADFLAAHPGETWEGYKCLGELPAPTPAVSKAPAEERLSAEQAAALVEAAHAMGEPSVDDRPALSEPVGTASLVIAGDKVYSDDFAGAEPMSALPDGTIVVAGGLPITQGSSDTYLPVDQGAQL